MDAWVDSALAPGRQPSRLIAQHVAPVDTFCEYRLYGLWQPLQDWMNDILDVRVVQAKTFCLNAQVDRWAITNLGLVHRARTNLGLVHRPRGSSMQLILASTLSAWEPILSSSNGLLNPSVSHFYHPDGTFIQAGARELQKETNKVLTAVGI